MKKAYLLLGALLIGFIAFSHGVSGTGATTKTCKDAGGVCVEYPAICETEYKGTISKAGTCSGKEDCCIPQGAATAAAGARTGFLSLQLPACVTATDPSKAGACTLDDIVRTGAAFANLLTALSAALFFGTFVYGGARYLLSFGRKEWVDAGKKAMTGAAFGMAIVIGAWTLVNYIANSIQGIK